MTRINRVKSSLIETNKVVKFFFNGKKYYGFKGDTLASALLANNIKLIQDLSESKKGEISKWKL